MRLHPRVAALAAFAALTVPFGTAVHLLAECAAGGAGSLFAPRHAYLALFDVLAFAVLSAILRRGGFDRRRVSLLAAALPWRGRGPRFFTLGCAAQCAFFAITIAGEQSPLCAGNLVLAALVACAASLLGATILSLSKARILEAIAELVFAVTEAAASDAARRSARSGFPVHAPRRTRFYLFVPTRPPPPILASA